MPATRSVRRSAAAVMAFGLLVAVGLGLWRCARLAPGLDHRATADLVEHRTDALTTAAHVFSTLGRSWVLILATASLGFAIRSRLGWRAFAPLVAVLGSELLQHVVKGIVGRPRPLVLHLEHVTGSSFPSGHATESAAVAVALFLLIGRRSLQRQWLTGILMAIVVTAIGASRVYLGVHYCTDVLAGFLLGSAWGLIATWWFTGRDLRMRTHRPEA